MVVFTCNPSTGEDEVGGSLQVREQPELHSATLSHKDRKKILNAVMNNNHNIKDRSYC